MYSAFDAFYASTNANVKEELNRNLEEIKIAAESGKESLDISIKDESNYIRILFLLDKLGYKILHASHPEFTVSWSVLF